MIANLTEKSPVGTRIFTTDIDGNLAQTGTYLGGYKSGTHASGRWTLVFWCRIGGVARWMSFPKTYTDDTDLPMTRYELATRLLRHSRRDIEDLTDEAEAGKEWAVTALAEETARMHNLEREIAEHDAHAALRAADADQAEAEMMRDMGF